MRLPSPWPSPEGRGDRRVGDEERGRVSFFTRNSDAPVHEPIDETADHLGDDLDPLAERRMSDLVHQPFAAGQFQQRHALLGRATGDDEEVLAIGLGKTPITLGQIGGDRQRGAVELIGKEIVAARKR